MAPSQPRSPSERLAGVRGVRRNQGQRRLHQREVRRLPHAARDLEGRKHRELKNSVTSILRSLRSFTGIVLLSASAASAQTTVTLPDTSQTTAVSVNVSEQARVVVPPAIS